MSPLERPNLADRPPPPPPPPAQPRASVLPSDFRRRLSYYLTGVAIGVLLVIPILSAKCQARKNAANAPASSGPTLPVP